MELQQLKYFKTVAEIGKISTAAEALFLSAPALSTSISRLEKELGMPLFHRTGNRIQLNPQGTIFLRHVNKVFDELEATKVELQESLQPVGEHVSVATMSSTQWVDLISAFSQTHSEITLSCSSIKISQLTENGLPPQHTFLLGSEDAIPEAYRAELNCIPMFHDSPVIVVHASHPLANRKNVAIDELEQETLFLPMADYPLRSHVEALFENSSLPFPSENAYPHFVCQQLAADKMGVSFASAHTVMLPALNLRYVPIRTDHKPWTAYLYWRKDRELTVAAQTFADFAKAYYSADNVANQKP